MIRLFKSSPQFRKKRTFFHQQPLHKHSRHRFPARSSSRPSLLAKFSHFRLPSFLPKYKLTLPGFRSPKRGLSFADLNRTILNHRWLLVSSTLISSVILGCFLLYPHFHPAYSCQTNYLPCPESINQWLTQRNQLPIHTNWSTLPTDLSREFPEITTVGLSWSHWNQITVTITLDRPVAAVTSPRLSAYHHYLLVSEQGRAITTTDRPLLLPVLELIDIQTPTGDILPSNHLKAVQLAIALYHAGYAFTAKQTDTATLSVILTENIPILLPLTDSTVPQNLVNALQLILSEATIDANHQIDLRYQPPVIRDLRVTIAPTPEATVSAESGSNIKNQI